MFFLYFQFTRFLMRKGEIPSRFRFVEMSRHNFLAGFRRRCTGQLPRTCFPSVRARVIAVLNRVADSTNPYNSPLAIARFLDGYTLTKPFSGQAVTRKTSPVTETATHNLT